MVLAEWQSIRDMQLQPGTIPAKHQQLIMLGVSTYAKCKYCTDFHTEAGKAVGATAAAPRSPGSGRNVVRQ